jgi:hypothetical protein
MNRFRRFALVAAVLVAAVSTARAGDKKDDDKSTPVSTPTPSIQNQGRIDVNTASSEQLQTLPGITAIMAAKIIQNRPYQALGQLTRAGLNPAQIGKIANLVMVSNPYLPGSHAPYAPRPSDAATHHLVSSGPLMPNAKDAGGQTHSGEVPKYIEGENSNTRPRSTGATPTPTPVPGKANPVWADHATRLYYKTGDPNYGHTKSGQYMTEEEAIKAGYHLAKPPTKPGTAGGATSS